MTELAAGMFGNDFVWGVSTAAYQIEGAHLSHGKGASIWDEFTNTRGRIYENQNANISCNFYHNYNQDLALMRGLNIQNFRFSLSWSRIFPEGRSRVNRAGVDFYNRVLDFCLELEIEPWVTIYHWDLPAELQKQGGWTNRDVIGWFGEYVSFCIKTFGDRVRHWMILNEPLAFTGAGYGLGIHAPGKKGLTTFLPAAHHAALCQAEGGRIARSERSNISIGTTFSFSHIDAYSENPNDVAAATRIDAVFNRFFVEPLLGLGYPLQEINVLKRIEQYMKDGDEAKLKFDMDFIGVQAYTREVVAHSYLKPFLHAHIVKAQERGVPHTEMNWEVFPKSIYNILTKLNNYKNIPPLIVTENGAAFDDIMIDGNVYDTERIKYLETHIEQVLMARQHGVAVKGYFVWTLMDNFEWKEGFRPRFGLVHVDFNTQKRTVKSSGMWYSRFLSYKNISQTGARILSGSCWDKP